MRIDDLKMLMDRRPFVPFSVGLADGRHIPVMHENALAWSNDFTPLLVVIQADGRYEVVHGAAVTGLAAR
jgi:hypothetical protein